MDAILSFDFHTNHIITKLNRSLFCINRAKNILPLSALRSLYFALVHSHLSYCPIITSCTNASNIQKISLVQCKAICIITKTNYHEHTAPLFKSLQILLYQQLITFVKLNFMNPLLITIVHHHSIQHGDLIMNVQVYQTLETLICLPFPAPY